LVNRFKVKENVIPVPELIPGVYIMQILLSQERIVKKISVI